MHLRGWQRIGVILSVIWFIGFAGYIWYSDRKEKADFYGWQLHMCAKTWDSESPNRAEYDRCNEEAGNFYAVQVAENGGWVGWVLLIGVDLLTIAIAWLLAWLTITVARWVRRGFHHA